jgi:hypothetical protein
MREILEDMKDDELSDFVKEYLINVVGASARALSYFFYDFEHDFFVIRWEEEHDSGMWDDAIGVDYVDLEPFYKEYFEDIGVS